MSFFFFFFILSYIELYYSFQVCNFIFFNTFKLNTKLLNGLFLIHPYFIYFFYSFLFLLFFLLYLLKIKIYTNNYRNIFEYFYKKETVLKYLALYFGIVAIMLGSW